MPVHSPKLSKQLLTLLIVGAATCLPGTIAIAASDNNAAAPSTLAELLDAWMQTADAASNTWSREALLSQILGRSRVGTRDEMIGVLGPPNDTLELYHTGYGLIDRFDTYRLSAKNDRSYRLTYRPTGELDSQRIESLPCGCPKCDNAGKLASAAISAQTADDFLAALNDKPASPEMLSEAEQTLGRTGVKQTDLGVQMGGHVWANFEVIWPIADHGHRFLIASGSLPMNSYSADTDLPITDYSLETVSDECLNLPQSSRPREANTIASPIQNDSSTTHAN